METLILKKLDRVDMRLDKIDLRLDEHDRRFDAHDKRFDEHDRRFDAIAATLLRHEEKIQNIENNMATKQDIGKIMTVLDGIVIIVKRLDEDRFITHHRLNRIEEKIGIKPKTKLA
jgi:hypothetical protein